MKPAARVRIVTDPNNPRPGVTGSLNPKTYAAFDKIATQRGKSKSALVSEVIEEFVKKETAA